jgi:PPK2 family polyphosphate:nucleotide phosphotransferase
MANTHQFDLKKFRVSFGEKLRIRKLSTGGPSIDGMKEKATQALASDAIALQGAQERLYADGKQSLLVILQGMDAAGKDGTIRHVMGGINPQGCVVSSFKAPNSEELQYHFLMRPMRCLPKRGMMGIFNRSYYEEVLVVRVHPEYLKPQVLPSLKKGESLWEHRFAEIRNFEEMLTRHGTTVIKFFLNVSQKEQRKRLLERLKDPSKHWKFNAGDLKERALFSKYEEAIDAMLPATSTKTAPWYVIPADDKWYTRAVVADIITQHLHKMDLKFPEVPAEELEKYPEYIQVLEREITSGDDKKSGRSDKSTKREKSGGKKKSNAGKSTDVSD